MEEHKDDGVETILDCLVKIEEEVQKYFGFWIDCRAGVGQQEWETQFDKVLRKLEVVVSNMKVMLAEREGMPWFCRKMIYNSNVRSFFLYGIEIWMDVKCKRNARCWMMKVESRWFRSTLIGQETIQCSFLLVHWITIACNGWWNEGL